MSLPGQIATTVKTKTQTLATLTKAGIVRPARPDKLVALGVTLARWGPTPAAGYTVSATRYPDDVAIVDEAGTLTFKQVHERTNALAHAFADAGIGPGDGVAIMCRNHRGFIETVVACSKLGAHALFLNTAFSKPQLTDVLEREEPAALVYDQEFAELLGDADVELKRYIAWHEPEEDSGDERLEDLVTGGDTSDLKPPKEPGKATILTSGTTGTPKGANRSQPKSMDPIAALLDRIPLRARETTVIAAPLFHSWGYAHWSLGISLASTVVLKRKFDPEATLSLTAQHQATALVVVPVMLQRILELDDETLEALRPRRGQGRAGLGLRAAGLAVGPLDGPVRRQPVQPLRLHRGRLGDDRHAEGPARGAGDRRQAAARDRREDLRRRRQAGSPSGRRAASSSATRCSSRATRAAATRTSSRA